MVRISQKIIAIIPARGGSKRIKNKNLVRLAGKPLLAHSILQARKARGISRVVVSTEDTRIAAVAEKFGAEVVLRPRKLAADKSSSEEALLHVLGELKKQESFEPDLVVFLQCTSPVRKPQDIEQAVKTLLTQKADSLFSACRNHSLIWEKRAGKFFSLNYDFRRRLREQKMPPQYRENGSIYIFKPKVLERYHNRLGGKIAVYEMSFLSSFQIDELNDIKLIELLQPLVNNRQPVLLPSQVDLVVFDFDGVFTDNKVKTDQHGKEYIMTSRIDSLGLDFLRQLGVPAMVLSTEKHPVVAARCHKLKLPCHQGIGNKKEYLAKYLQENNIDPQNVVYVGNDVNDLECFRLVGFAAAVADSNPKIISEADYVLRHRGGKGAVREICELIVQKYHER